MFPFEFSNYYYLVLILQAGCVIHSMRRGNQQKWIWLIVFLPVIGSLAYLFTEVFSKRDLANVQENLGNVLYPAGKIRDMEKRLQFSNTFQNRTELADAYLASGNVDKAIELYESSLEGIFKDNEHVLRQLLIAYYQKERYADVVAIAPRAAKAVDFKKSKAQLMYALSLEKVNKLQAAETEFRAVNSRYSNFEARVQYGRFLARMGKQDEADTIFQDIVEESAHIHGAEARANRRWFNEARQELERVRA